MKWNHHRDLKNLFESDNLIGRQKGIQSCLVFGNKELPKREICIIIPNYNRHALFRKALETAVKQSVGFEHYNILVVDDSQDEIERKMVLKAVEELAKDNIQYYQNESQLGLFGNMNRGAVLANSEWICFLHNDDILYEDAIERALMAIDKIADENTASIYPTHDFIRENGKISKTNAIQIKRPIYRWLITLEHKRIKRRELKKLCFGDEEHCVAPSCGAMFRKNIFLEYGGYGEGYGAGDLFLLYGLSVNHDCYIINEAWGAFRWEDNESLNEETIAAYIEERYLIMEYFKRYADKNLWQTIDLKIQYKIFYYAVIKNQLEGMSEEEIKIFIEKYLPQDIHYHVNGCYRYIQRARAFLVDKYIMTYNIRHSKKLPYKMRNI